MENPIVVVDDMRHILDLVKEVLNVTGYNAVVTFQDPLEARRRIMQDITPSVIITDFRMPNMTGAQLLDEVRLMYPNISGIIMTGDPRSAREATSQYKVLDKGHKDFCKNLIDFISSTLPANEVQHM